MISGLLRLLPRSRKYVVFGVFWRWISLVAGFFMIYGVASLLTGVSHPLPFVTIIMGALLVGFLSDECIVKCKIKSVSDIRRITGRMALDKIESIGPSYRENISDETVIGFLCEGTGSLERYITEFIPTVLFSALSAVTIFAVMINYDAKTASVLLLFSIISFIFSFIIIKTKNEPGSIIDIITYGGSLVGMCIAAAGYFQGRIRLMPAIISFIVSAVAMLPFRRLGSLIGIAVEGENAISELGILFGIRDREAGLDRRLGDKVDIRFDNVCLFGDEGADEINACFHSGRVAVYDGDEGGVIAGILSGRKTYQSGNVKLNGVELSGISPGSACDIITYVGDDSYIFSGTVRDNLLMGDPDADDNKCKAALKKVSFIIALELADGLDTRVAEDGGNLSKGQRMRLLVARALLHDTPVYVFDNVRSGVDDESRKVIESIINDISYAHTVLDIRHSDMPVLYDEGSTDARDREISEGINAFISETVRGAAESIRFGNFGKRSDLYEKYASAISNENGKAERVRDRIRSYIRLALVFVFLFIVNYFVYKMSRSEIAFLPASITVCVLAVLCLFVMERRDPYAFKSYHKR